MLTNSRLFRRNLSATLVLGIAGLGVMASPLVKASTLSYPPGRAVTDWPTTDGVGGAHRRLLDRPNQDAHLWQRLDIDCQHERQRRLGD